MYVLLLLAVLVLWKLQDFYFRRNWLRKLTVRLEFKDSHVYEGDTSGLKEVVINDKRMPLPAVHVRLSIPRSLRFADEVRENTVTSDQTYKRDIFSFPGRQQITRTLPFTAVKRGFYELKSVDLTANDYFFHANGYLAMPQQAQLYVYPRQISTSRISLLCREISGTVPADNRLHPDPFEFSGIRDYRRSDPMNRINWKASARTGNLMVNQFDSTTNQNITILLDVDDSAVFSREICMEEAIRIASSLAGQLAEHKMPFRICATDGTDLFLPVGGGRIGELNRALAMIDAQHPSVSAAALMEEQIREKVRGHIYVLISSRMDEEMKKTASQLASADNRILWVVPFAAGEEVADGRIPSVRFLKWEVMS